MTEAAADLAALRARIEWLFAASPGRYSPEDRQIFEEFRAVLSAGTIRAAEPDLEAPAGWRVNGWVKQGILIGFRMGELVDMSAAAPGQRFFDKDTFPLRQTGLGDGIRIVPGGSSIRSGSYVARGVTCMPPMYINVGAYVAEGTMIDSHALVGSCAQVGRHCHISAAAQLGGVLEPVGLLPVVIEDEVLVGGNCGVYEGTVVQRGAVLGSGTILNRSTPVYDIVRQQIYRATDQQPLVVPAGAVVVAGSRPIAAGVGRQWNLSLYTPVIVKYRDSSTETKIQLEELLR